MITTRIPETTMTTARKVQTIIHTLPRKESRVIQTAITGTTIQGHITREIITAVLIIIIAIQDRAITQEIVIQKALIPRQKRNNPRSFVKRLIKKNTFNDFC
jgi:hypothetical protein